MNALLIDPQTKTISSHDFDGQVNTLYTLFDSLLLEHFYTLNGHIIYTDTNAFEQDEPALFIGEQLFFGKTLVIGLEGFGEVDAKIKPQELKSLISYKINAFYTSALGVLKAAKVNFYAPFEGFSEDKELEINCEWVLYTFNMADEATQEYFLTELFKVEPTAQAVLEYMKKMAKLAISAGENQ